MSDIEKEKFRQIGMTLVNEYRQQRGLTPIRWLAIDTPEASAFIRSIQLHEKTKKELQGVKQELADFRQEVSDAVELSTGLDTTDCVIAGHINEYLGRFIIPAPKPDPLVEATLQVFPNNPFTKEHFERIRAALDALGFEIREKNDGHS